MGSYGHVFIKGRAIFSFKDDVDPTFMLLFRKADLRRVTIRASDRPDIGYEPDEEIEAYEFAVSSAVLRERLDVLGIGIATVEDAFKHIVAEQRERYEGWLNDGTAAANVEWAQHLEAQIQAFSGLSLESWEDAVRAAVARHEGATDRQIGSLAWLLELWDYLDPRLALRAIAAAFPDDEVVLDVTDLREGGWFDMDQDPRTAALEHFSWVSTNGAPVVVLTEGSWDAYALGTSLRVLRPHLEGFLRFPDFSTGAEGGAGAEVRLVKALAAAGVANRVVALFDNDTAAAEALTAIGANDLPPNFTVLTLPPIPLAEHYPTRGPSGTVEMDVNGLAGGLELYLGTDVLRDSSGDLRPVQWTGFSQRMARYQGELIGKRSLHEQFDRKLEAAFRSRGPAEVQDWDDLNRVFDALRSALESL